MQIDNKTVTFLGFNAAAELRPFCSSVPRKKLPGVGLIR